MGYEIIMVIDGQEYIYGMDRNRDRANEIAMEIRNRRGIWVYVQERILTI